MPFNTLLLTCLTPCTHFSERGSRVRLNPLSEEIVLFFVIDDQSNPRSTFRRDCNINGPMCDVIVFYRKGDKQVLCLVELKGSELDKAVDQVTNTFEVFKDALAKSKVKSGLSQIEWKAYIYVHGSAPRETKKLKKTLDKVFGKNNCQISGQEDLGSFIRD